MREGKKRTSLPVRPIFFGVLIGGLCSSLLQAQQAEQLYDQIRHGVRFGVWIVGVNLVVKYLFYRQTVRNIPRALKSLLVVQVLSMLLGCVFFSVQPNSYLLPTPITWAVSSIDISSDGVVGHVVAPLLFSVLFEPLLLVLLFQPSRPKRVWVAIPIANLFAVLVERTLFVFLERFL
jgi:hypothetical protein